MLLFSFFRKTLDGLTDAKTMRSAISYVLKILGILSIVGGVYLLVDILKEAFSLSTEGTIGGLMLAVFLAAGLLTIVQILFHRSRHIREIEDSEFTIIPMFAILVKALGEIYATFLASIGVGGCIYIWMAKSDPMYFMGNMIRFLPNIPGEGTFLGGILFLVYAYLWAFAALIGSYFIAESSVVLIDIAKNSRHSHGHQRMA